MAHLEIAFVGDPPADFIFINLDEAVGVNAPDPRADDTTVVQWFIQQIYDNAARFSPPLSRPNLPKLVVNGRPSQNLNSWIRQFQSEARKRGHSIAVDGRVDTSKTIDAVSTISHTTYTIAWLNGAFRTARPDAKDKPFDQIADAPDLLKVVLGNVEPNPA
jgi:hypothetical protein